MNDSGLMESPLATDPQVGSTLLADLLWCEYQDAADAARAALAIGDKLAALTLAIWAHKIKEQYHSEIDKLLFS